MKTETRDRVMPAQSENSRNPFGVMDVPDPNGQDVADFAARTTLGGGADDVNASAWDTTKGKGGGASIEGDWSSRWNGGADPTIQGDTKEKWKAGQGELKIVGDRAYILFDWNNGARSGLIDARIEVGNRLVGKYINLGNTEIRRAWVGLIVGNDRIDGKFSEGRLDFRR